MGGGEIFCRHLTYPYNLTRACTSHNETNVRMQGARVAIQVIAPANDDLIHCYSDIVALTYQRLTEKYYLMTLPIPKA